jgi:hypothetical protein
MDVVELVNKYGFPIVMAVGMGFIIKYVWTWATTEVKPVISEANTVLIALIDRIRMLDNDLIRLNQKVNTVLHLRGKSIEHERVEAEKLINQSTGSAPALNSGLPAPLSGPLSVHRKGKTVDDQEAGGGSS